MVPGSLDVPLAWGLVVVLLWVVWTWEGSFGSRQFLHTSCLKEWKKAVSNSLSLLRTIKRLVLAASIYLYTGAFLASCVGVIKNRKSCDLSLWQRANALKVSSQISSTGGGKLTYIYSFDIKSKLSPFTLHRRNPTASLIPSFICMMDMQNASCGFYCCQVKFTSFSLYSQKIIINWIREHSDKTFCSWLFDDTTMQVVHWEPFFRTTYVPLWK